MIEPIVEKLIELKGRDWIQQPAYILDFDAFQEYGDLFHSQADNFPMWGPALLDCVGSGAHSNVYGLSSDHVIKLPFLKEGLSIIRELIISSHLYEDGVSVPKPEGIFKIAISKEDQFQLRELVNVEKAGFVMERIHGEVIDSTMHHHKADLSRVIELMVAELAKCEKLGYVFNDTGPHNAIYDAGHDRIYLIDFGSWTLSNRRSRTTVL
jgi:hypothetical protein